MIAMCCTAVRGEVVHIAPAESGFIVLSSLRVDTLYPLGLRRVLGPADLLYTNASKAASAHKDCALNPFGPAWIVSDIIELNRTVVDVQNTC